MSLHERVVDEAATPGAMVAKNAMQQAQKKWGAGWRLLSGEQQAGAVAVEILRLYGTKVPGASADMTEKLLHDAWRPIAGLL